MRNKALILDRDGVINELVNHNGKETAPWSFEEFKLMPNVSEAIDLGRKMGYTLIVLSNQPDVLDGKLALSDLTKMDNVLKELGIEWVDNIFDRKSWFYKPNPGALAYWGYGCDLDYFIGDTWKDIVCAHKAGIKSIYCSDKRYDYKFPIEYHMVDPDYMTTDLLSAMQLIERLNNNETIL
jgi:D-glycero-D-manno-heptose 1,7-bisphosphate phosphatase